jgi:hypothetical protein
MQVSIDFSRKGVGAKKDHLTEKMQPGCSCFCSGKCAVDACTSRLPGLSQTATRQVRRFLRGLLGILAFSLTYLGRPWGERRDTATLGLLYAAFSAFGGSPCHPFVEALPTTRFYNA